MRQLPVSHYTISRLLASIVEQSGLRRSDFVQSLGYKNINSGLRALDGWLETAEGSPFLLENLVKVRGIDPGLVSKALEETDQQRQREEEQERIAQERYDREHFRPY